MNARLRNGFARATLAAALLAAGCETGSETGNPTTKGLTGLLRTADGLPAASARVVLVPAGFDPLDDRALAGLRETVTDTRGRYRFDDVPPGRYNLQAEGASDGTRARIAGIESGDSLGEVPARSLAMPGSIAAALSGAADTVTGFVYVPGSTYRAPVRAAAGLVRLDSLPPGTVDSLVYGSAPSPSGPAPAPRRAFAWNLSVTAETEARAAGPYLAWRRSAALLLDPAAAPAVDVAGFPLRIALPDSVSAAARPGLADLRATDERGDPLPCEAQGAAVWVRLDTAYAREPTRVRLYWSYGGPEPLPPGAAKAGAVFSAADGFAGAWHLDEDPAANGGRLADASERGNDAIAYGFDAAGASVEGVAGPGLAFDGATRWVASRTAYQDPEAFTVLVWFRAPRGPGGRMVEFADRDSVPRPTYWDRLLHLYPDGTVHFGVYPPDTAGRPMPTASTYKIVSGPGAYDDGAWHQAAARLSPAGQDLFLDGVRVAHDPASREAQNIRGYWRLGYGVLSGWAPPGSGEWYLGALDEFWVAHAALPDAYVKLAYENLKPGSRLVRWP